MDRSPEAPLLSNDIVKQRKSEQSRVTDFFSGAELRHGRHRQKLPVLLNGSVTWDGNSRFVSCSSHLSPQEMRIIWIAQVEWKSSMFLKPDAEDTLQRARR